MPENRRTTAAWRIALWTTLAFSVGTFVAFFIVYLVMAKEIWARSDAWLTGEAQVLAEVAEGTPRDRLYNKIVKEVAELAMHEVPDERSPRGRAAEQRLFPQGQPGAWRGHSFRGAGIERRVLACDPASAFCRRDSGIDKSGWMATRL